MEALTTPGTDLNAIERLFSTVGLNTPLLRIAAVSAGSGFLFNTMKPALFFKADGTPKGFGLEGGDSTVLPWWAASAILGIAAGLFI